MRTVGPCSGSGLRGHDRGTRQIGACWRDDRPRRLSRLVKTALYEAELALHDGDAGPTPGALVSVDLFASWSSGTVSTAPVTSASDATIDGLDLDAPGRVPWWTRPEVKLINVIAHVLAETNRHAGHADILREQLDGSTGAAPDEAGPPQRDAAWWASDVAKVEAAARAVGTS